MALPTMTPEQRAAALAKAAEARKARSELLQQVKSGEIGLADLLERSEEDLVKKLKVATVLKAIPGFGPVKLDKVMSEAAIPDDRRIGGLGPRQRTALLEAASH
ncbi:integration host factor, actinobacterial type [Nocardia concava]|uniref:integration host factor, actinobacterial type n=1 Tax=Nocardia concava TaxID=257281 RepID=UPI0002FF5407|nr:integration host factor, actinobacterial type [Nocardia concava]